MSLEVKQISFSLDRYLHIVVVFYNRAEMKFILNEKFELKEEETAFLRKGRRQPRKVQWLALHPTQVIGFNMSNYIKSGRKELVGSYQKAILDETTWVIETL